MNIAGPSRLHSIPKARDRSNYEEGLTRMVTQLDPSDIETFQASCGARVRRGQELSDQEIAFVLLMQNARELANIEADRAAAERLALEEDGEPDPAPRVQHTNVLQPVTTKAKSKRKRRGKSSVSFSTPASSSKTSSCSSQAPTTIARAPPRATGHNCVICQDPIFEAEVQAPCGHFYDINCVTDLFKAATRDESLYPPRCCRQTIPLPQVRPHLTQPLLAEFELKAQEFGTLKRVYCAAPACSRFLGPLYEGSFFKIYACPSPTCAAVTCGKCRMKYEEFDHYCAPDAETERVLTLSRASGWSRCPGCAQMIELDVGCYHMTCRCKTEFCYVCRASWKNCPCPQWDENRLLAAAERRADAQLQHENRGQPARNPLDHEVDRHAFVQPRPVRNQPANPPRPVPAVAPRRPTLFGNIQPTTGRANAPIVTLPHDRPALPRAEATVPIPHPSARTWAAIVKQNDDRWITRPADYRGLTETVDAVNTAGSRDTLNATDGLGAMGIEDVWGSVAPTPHPPTRTWATLAAQSAGRWNARPVDHHGHTETVNNSRDAADTADSRNPSSATDDWGGADNSDSWSVAGKANNWHTSRERLVREIMERLRVDHDCQHTTWRYRSGSGNCDSCFEYLPNYLFRCGECEMLCCSRCRLNRL